MKLDGLSIRAVGEMEKKKAKKDSIKLNSTFEQNYKRATRMTCLPGKQVIKDHRLFYFGWLNLFFWLILLFFGWVKIFRDPVNLQNLPLRFVFKRGR